MSKLADRAVAAGVWIVIAFGVLIVLSIVLTVVVNIINSTP